MSNRVYYIFCLIFLVLVSCTGRRKLVYFQGKMNSSEAIKSFNPVLQVNDLLSITVSGIDPETVKPFNLPTTGSMAAAGGYQQGTQAPSGYLVDPDGYIEFPLVGRVKIAGLTRSVIIDSLKFKLKPYLNNPTILIRVLNFKVTVLGEVRGPGTFTIPNERITLPEALGIAGDLLITAKRKNILVIRDVDGTKIEFRVDLTTNELFSSPVYYLNQNDVVYVEPNRARINSSVLNVSNAGVFISAVSMMVTILVLVLKK